MLTSWISLFAAKDSGIVLDWPSLLLFVRVRACCAVPGLACRNLTSLIQTSTSIFLRQTTLSVIIYCRMRGQRDELLHRTTPKETREITVEHVASFFLHRQPTSASMSAEYVRRLLC